ncbi:MAG: hypothetical protein EON58_10335 [Alphaproteobacteria bacterium]|nr:MAG: hypothetical protein EON58_10335 [Alphaproteobacteria bacterium]
MTTNRDQFYLCIGYTDYTNSTPSLSEPVFSLAGSQDLFVQEIDEATNLIVGFRKELLQDSELHLITSSLRAKIDDQPVYCINFGSKPSMMGKIANLRPHFQSLFSEESTPEGLKIQLAEIIGSPSSIRKSKIAFDRILSQQNTDSTKAYHRSVARVSLWRRLSVAAVNLEARTHFTRIRGRLDVTIGENGSISVHLDDLDPNDFPTIDFSLIGKEIESEIGAIEELPDQGAGSGEYLEEITQLDPASLKKILDSSVGIDRRISTGSYRSAIRLLQKLGFVTSEQVIRATEGHNGLQLGHIVFGNRQGQITKFELMLLSALGEYYVDNNTWSYSLYYKEILRSRLKKIQAANIKTGTFDLGADSARLRGEGYAEERTGSQQMDLL